MGARRVDWTAEKKLAKKRARVLAMMSDPEGEVTVELWLSSYLELFPSERSVGAERQHLSMLRGFRTAEASEHGAMKVARVTPMLAQQWALTCSPNQIRHLSRAWQKAVVMGVANTNVWRLVTLPRRQKAPVCAPTAEELRGILRQCETRSLAGESWWIAFADLIEVAAYSGAREAGLMGLRRSAVDLAGGRFTVTEKGEKTRTIVLCGPGRDAMRRRLDAALPCLAMPARHMVFLNRRRELLTAYVVQDAWRQVRGDFPHGFHSLKHYAATWLRAQGVSADDVAIQLGHTDAAGRPQAQLQQRVYVHPDHSLALERIDMAVAS